MKVNYITYLVRDSHGNEDFDVAREEGNTISICGMKTKVGDNLFFECEAYHLKQWCEEEGLEYKMIERSEEIKI